MDSFFVFRQTPSTRQRTQRAEALYTVVVTTSVPGKGNDVFNLVRDTGPNDVLLAQNCERVHGLERVDGEMQNSRRNAERRWVGNAEFVRVDLKEMKDAFVRAGDAGAQDVVVVDQPREGPHKSLSEQLARS